MQCLDVISFKSQTYPNLAYLALSRVSGVPSGTSPTKNSIFVAESMMIEKTTVFLFKVRELIMRFVPLF